MSVVYIVLPLALVLSSLAVVAFIWAVRRGQLDDTVTPPVRILLDDPEAAHTDSAADREVRADDTDSAADREVRADAPRPERGPESTPKTDDVFQPKSRR
jgi:cbb3-type cytochrome oxidase maturation protein